MEKIEKRNKVLFEEEWQESKSDSKARQTVFLLFFFGISSFTSPSHQRQERIVVVVQQCFCFFRATKIEASSCRLPRNAGDVYNPFILPYFSHFARQQRSSITTNNRAHFSIFFLVLLSLHVCGERWRSVNHHSSFPSADTPRLRLS